MLRLNLIVLLLLNVIFLKGQSNCIDFNGTELENVEFYLVDDVLCSGNSATLVIDISPDNLHCSIEIFDVYNNTTVLPTTTFFTGIPNVLYTEITVNSSISTVYVLNVIVNGPNGVCTTTSSCTLTIPDEIQIELPSSFVACNGNFEEVCAPNEANYSYEWYGPDHDPTMLILLGESMCFTPTQAGIYTLVVTDEY